MTPSAQPRVGAARLMIGDATIVFLLLNEARRRITSRLFGVPRDKSFLVGVLATGEAAKALHAKTAPVRRLRSGPSAADLLLGAAVLKETVNGIAGTRDKETQGVAALIAVAVLGHTLRPALEGSIRGARAQAHRIRAFLGGRYGG